MTCTIRSWSIKRSGGPHSFLSLKEKDKSTGSPTRISRDEASIFITNLSSLRFSFQRKASPTATMAIAIMAIMFLSFIGLDVFPLLFFRKIALRPPQHFFLFYEGPRHVGGGVN